MSGAPTLEQRIAALEQQLAPIAAKNLPKLTTRQVGYLTAALGAATWVLANVSGLPPWAVTALTLAVSGITAFEAAEQT